MTPEEQNTAFRKIIEVLSGMMCSGEALTDEQIFWMKKTERCAYRAIYQREPDWDE